MAIYFFVEADAHRLYWMAIGTEAYSLRVSVCALHHHCLRLLLSHPPQRYC